eukprot:c23252_g1_i1.p1 GENE.c23252_g1_i1~~c23252_g1_i1.p1  ORF type:complete len:195 (+),score=50.19 c23252_g1_i1:39-587(+)
MSDEPVAKKQKLTGGINLNKALDKEFEVQPLSEIVESPVSCLQGLAERADDILKEFNIKSVRQLGTWRFFQYAVAIVELASVEEEGKRSDDALMNINLAIDKSDRHKSLKELAESPVSVFNGISDEGNAILGKLHIKTVSDLGRWKYARWAHAMTVLADKEQPHNEPCKELKSLAEPSIHDK